MALVNLSNSFKLSANERRSSRPSLAAASYTAVSLHTSSCLRSQSLHHSGTVFRKEDQSFAVFGRCRWSLANMLFECGTLLLEYGSKGFCAT